MKLIEAIARFSINKSDLLIENKGPMKFEDFQKKIERLGLKVEEGTFSFKIYQNEVEIAGIFGIEENALSIKTIIGCEKQIELIEICVSFAMTDINKR